MKNKLITILGSLIAILFIGILVSAQTVGPGATWFHTRGLLKPITTVSQVLIGGTTTSTSADLEIQGSIGLNGTAITDWSEIQGVNYWSDDGVTLIPVTSTRNISTTGTISGGWGSAFGGLTTDGLAQNNYVKVEEFLFGGAISIPAIVFDSNSLPLDLPGASSRVGGVLEGLWIGESDSSGNDGTAMNWGYPKLAFVGLNADNIVMYYNTSTDVLHFANGAGYSFDSGVVIEDTLFVSSDITASDSDGILYLGREGSGWESLSFSNAQSRFNLSNDLNVSGAITSTGDICISGGNCLSDGGGITTFLATTTATFDGVVTTSTLTGYVAANNVCASEFTGSHLCTDGEIMSYIANGGDISGWGADVSTAWYAEVAPGYLANANDCGGFTNNSNTYLGAFYLFNATTGGRGALVNCSNFKSLACCK